MLQQSNSAYALEKIDSSSYKLKFPNLNPVLDSNSGTTSSQILGSSEAETPTFFYVRAGYPYLKTITPFSLTISNISIDFGVLTPEQAFTRTQTLTVSTSGAGYAVVASQNHPLQLLATNISIPDSLSYQLNGAGDFKQFSDESGNETAQTIMSANHLDQSRQISVTYKVSVSSNQAAGDYRNTITFLATPTY